MMCMALQAVHVVEVVFFCAQEIRRLNLQVNQVGDPPASPLDNQLHSLLVNRQGNQQVNRQGNQHVNQLDSRLGSLLLNQVVNQHRSLLRNPVDSPLVSQRGSPLANRLPSHLLNPLRNPVVILLRVQQRGAQQVNRPVNQLGSLRDSLVASPQLNHPLNRRYDPQVRLDNRLRNRQCSLAASLQVFLARNLHHSQVAILVHSPLHSLHHIHQDSLVHNQHGSRRIRPGSLREDLALNQVTNPLDSPPHNPHYTLAGSLQCSLPLYPALSLLHNLAYILRGSRH
jgi:hypothetical protein